MVVQWMLMVVSEDFEKQRLVVDVVNEGACDGDSEVLYVEEAERWVLAAVLQRLGGEGLVVAVHEVELAEDVEVVAGDAAHLEYDDAESELFAELQVLGQFLLVDALQLLVDVLARFVEVFGRCGARVAWREAVALVQVLGEVVRAVEIIKTLVNVIGQRRPCVCHCRA